MSSPDDQMRQLRAALPDDLTAPIDALIASLADDESVAGLALGDRAPLFALPDARGDRVALDDLLAGGPVVVSFYRGAWCPFCSIELRGLKEILPEIHALGASLVAVSPQAPDDSLGLAEKEALEFAVCSDLDQEVARAYRLRFRLSPEVEALYRQWGLDLGEQNADGSWHLPVPATYVLDSDGVVVARDVDPDYRRRMAPEAVLAALRGLAGDG